MSRCEITELLKEQCAHCKGLLTPEEEELQDRRLLIDLEKWAAKWK